MPYDKIIDGGWGDVMVGYGDGREESGVAAERSGSRTEGFG
jgi:hypothetical protein